MAILVAGLILFLGIHLVPATPTVRAALAESWGENRYKAAFSLVSALGLVLIIAGYALSDDRTRVFAPVPAARALAPYAMVASFILFAAANMRGHLRRVLRHPMLLGLLIWSTVHLLANGDRTGTVLFGAFALYALVDLVSAIGRGAVKSFDPTVKHDVIAVAGGTAVALVVMTFHRLLFGVPVVPFSI
ncbi:MAG TPA: NnrU family protein [Casimicrobiaceae bacterium]|nr:NnrU family protein [Casimicrobiaceae bacterium]